MAKSKHDDSGWHVFLSKYCLKCVVRQLSCNWKLVTGNGEDILEYLQNRYKIGFKWTLDSEKEFAHIENSNSSQVCLVCNGILSSSFVKECMKAIQLKLESENHVFTNFQLMIAMPLSLIAQEQNIRSVFTKYFGSNNVEKKSFTVKEIFKNLLESQIAEIYNVERKVEAEFEILLEVQNPQIDEIILPQLKQYHSDSFKNPKKKSQFNNQHKPATLKITITQVANAINHISSEELERLLSCLDSATCYKPSLKVKFNHQSIYLAGRYNKYSRNLPQTPWIIDGVKKMDHCVEEYLAQPMQAAYEASKYNFASSGREDVDVQMLGNGRPFMVELVNPKKCQKSQSFLKALEDRINSQSPDVAVSKLQIVDKSQSKLLKEGEAEKSKSYSALCCFIHPPTKEQLKMLENLHLNNYIDIQQKTPIRVLHRRTVATRSRKIFSLKVKQQNSGDPRLFKLELLTQAGTYIKEFVHGDFGRTVPSLQNFLGAEVDIIDLDVIGVNFDWPPL